MSLRKQRLNKEEAATFNFFFRQASQPRLFGFLTPTIFSVSCQADVLVG